MEISQLSAFIAVAEELHFGRAAERLHTAQPPLSRLIQQLERDVGARLFERTTRSVRLTDAGLALLPPARDVLESCRTGQAAVAASRLGEIGRVRIGFAGPSSHQLVGRLARRVRQEHPGIELALESATYGHEAMSELLDGRIDLAILRWSGVRPPGISWRAVQREHYVIVVPSDHRFARAGARSVFMRQMRDEAFVMLPASPGSDVRDRFIELCYRTGYAPKIAQVAPDSGTAMALVAAGVGSTFSVDSAVAQVPDEGLHALAVKDAAAPVYARLAWSNADIGPALSHVLTASLTSLPTPARGPASRAD
jgi:DNA-binding transcriptional LysR family regulator